jgi:hypothetical protein
MKQFENEQDDENDARTGRKEPNENDGRNERNARRNARIIYLRFKDS